MAYKKKAARPPVPAEFDENPPWTKETFARAKPLREMFPEIVANPPRIGRPPSLSPLVPVSVRIEPEILKAYQSLGDGWQKRMREAIKKGLPPKKKPAASRRAVRGRASTKPARKSA